jgi:hypothetical protein
MSSTRNKTVKRTQDDISGNAIFTPLMNFLQKETDSAFKRPWHRLERGLRMNRLRLFSEEEAKRQHLSEQEKNNLFILLNKSLEKKLLNSKTAVVYDMEEEKIKEIKGLVTHRNSAGETLFQLLDRKNAVTFRRRPAGTEATTSSEKESKL